jgi:hypothetical protein
MLDAPSHPVLVHFGQPEHGWLPVLFQASTFKLDFCASNVPTNPLDALCEALAVVPIGGSATVMWHLEPAIYRFVFENQAGEVTLEITEAPAYNKPSTCLLRLTGSVRTILLPFYKALAAFAGHKFSEAHWPVLAASRLKRLGQLLRSQH